MTSALYRVIAIACLLLLPSAAEAQSGPQTYPMAQGGEITLPMGELSFADRVASFAEGAPASRIDESREPKNALGPPSYTGLHEGPDGHGSFVALGCNGVIVLELVDNALVNVAGPDLHVWEVGPDVEPTRLAVSQNGTDWVEVGAISGGTASIDIAEHVQAGESFRFIRLTDVECQGKGGRWPGADIDAVAAVGTVERFVFDSAVLFDFDEASLKPQAREALTAFAEQVGSQMLSTLRIEGHTDSVGSESYNADLSRRRAEAVRAFLQASPALADVPMETRGAGETEPVADNESEAGRQKNRRVEILALP